jgi:outer membrane protein TolC
LNNLRTEKVKIESQLDAGNVALKFLMNLPQKDSLVLTDTLSEQELKDNLLEQSYNYGDRSEYKLLQVAQELGRYNIRRYKLSYLPTIAAFASYSKNAQRQKFNFFNDGSWFTTSIVGLSMKIPIFDGLYKQSSIRKARLELQKTNQNIEQLKASIDADVEQARLKIGSALITVDNQKRNMDLAVQVYNATKLKYEQGLGSNQEIYAAQTELKVAQSNYYGALYDAIVARIDYLKATGKL